MNPGSGRCIVVFNLQCESLGEDVTRMKLLLVVMSLLSSAALLGTGATASADGWCGPGMYFDGHFYNGMPVCSPFPLTDQQRTTPPPPPAGQTTCVSVGNAGDVALTNSTIVEPDVAGFATVGPSGYDWTAYSTNNYGVGGASPNLTATRIGADGKLCTTAQQRAHRLLDIVGFIDGDTFTPYQNRPTPTRILDTRIWTTTGLYHGEVYCSSSDNYHRTGNDYREVVPGHFGRIPTAYFCW
jgi:hypothetical protein